MGQLREPTPVLLVCAAFAGTDARLQRAADRLITAFGSMAFASEPFDFRETNYYAASMGANLRKQLFVFEGLRDADALPGAKLATNALEANAEPVEGVARPINLDPGYLTEAKFVLASTKDHAHRLYLGQGIFGEVTLHYQAGHWRPLPWTYPDYQRDDVRAFLLRARDYFRSLLKTDRR